MMSIERRDKQVRQIMRNSDRAFCQMVGHDFKLDLLEAWRTLGHPLGSKVYRCSRCKRRIISK